MTLKDVRKEAERYGLKIQIDGKEYVILLNGREVARVPKSISMHKLADVLANAAS